MKIRNKRKIRHRRLRAKISGTKARPRLSVFRSNMHMEAQLIDDVSGKTIFGAGDLKIKKGTKSQKAQSLGALLAKELLAKGYKKIVFDRGGYKYHGRIRALAESLRSGGIEF